MAYFSKVLLPDEQVRAVGRLHWAIFLRTWLWLMLSAAAGVAAFQFRQADAGDPMPGGYAFVVAGAAAAICLVVGLLSLLAALTRRATTEIVVTDRRVIFKEGFLRRRTMEMNLSKVETVDVIQSITGRIFNFGTVMVRGVGSSYEPLNLIANPLALRTAIIAQ